MPKQVQRIDYSHRPDEELARIAATMVFIWLGPKALAALVDACVEFAKRTDHHTGGMGCQLSV